MRVSVEVEKDSDRSSGGEVEEVGECQQHHDGQQNGENRKNGKKTVEVSYCLMIMLVFVLNGLHKDRSMSLVAAAAAAVAAAAVAAAE